MSLTKEDLQAIQSLLNPINKRLDTIQDDVSSLKDDVSSLKKDMAKHNHFTEPLLKAVKGGIDGVLEHNQQLDKIDSKVDDHDHRIWALEQKAI